MKHQFVKMIPPAGTAAYLPANDDAEKLYSKQDVGDRIEGNLHGIRSPKEHNKFFAMVREYKMLSGSEEPFEKLRRRLVFEAGYYDVMMNSKGEPFAVVQSLAYDKMDKEEYLDVHSRVLDVMIQHGDLSNEDQVGLIRKYNVRQPVEMHDGR